MSVVYFVVLQYICDNNSICYIRLITIRLDAFIYTLLLKISVLIL